MSWVEALQQVVFELEKHRRCCQASLKVSVLFELVALHHVVIDLHVAMICLRLSGVESKDGERDRTTSFVHSFA